MGPSHYRKTHMQPDDENETSATDDEVLFVQQRLHSMRVIWDQCRAEGVPIDQRPLDASLPWAVQFEAQARSDPTGKDMEWWKRQHGTTSL